MDIEVLFIFEKIIHIIFQMVSKKGFVQYTVNRLRLYEWSAVSSDIYILITSDIILLLHAGGNQEKTIGRESYYMSANFHGKIVLRFLKIT